MKFRLIGFLVLLLAAAVAGYIAMPKRDAPISEPDPILDQATLRSIGQGEIVGFSHHTNGAHVWRGIPYAEPPVDDLRWRAPQPFAGWRGTLEALPNSPWCTQVRRSIDDGSSADAIPLGDLMGQEDCLYLNVYAPKMDAQAAASAQLPVMFWIHGGSNVWGRAEQYDPSKLAETENVVVVVVQYRLGPLGWFAHDALVNDAQNDLDKTANFAILDLIAALDWTAANIKPFGGDPENITIFGESAGGHNVATLLATPLAAGKFHKAIIQSGSFRSTSMAEARTTHDKSGEKIATKLLGNNVTAEGLRKVPVDTLFAAYATDLTGFGWFPPRIIEDDVVIPSEGLAQRFQSTDTFNAVPIITGINRDETKLFNILDDKQIRWVLGLVPWARDQKIYDAKSEYESRMWRVSAVDLPIQDMIAGGHQDVYAYRFDWDEADTVLGADFSKLFGAAHGLEIPFVFNQFRFLGRADKWVFTEENRVGRETLSEAMMAYWAEFARNGKPGNGGKGNLVEWQKWSENVNSPNMIILDSNADGGVRFEETRESPQKVAEDIFSDRRFSSLDQACEIFRSALFWGKSLAAHDTRSCLK